MREMKDSGIEWIGEMPKDWKVVPIRYAFDEVTEKNKFGTEKTALKFTYGTIIPKTDFDADSDEYVANTIQNYTIVNPGVIMINCLNLNYDFVSQRIGLVKDRGVITSAYLAIDPKETINPEYANYLLKFYDYVKAFHNMGSGVRKTLDFGELGKKYCLIPAMSAQIQIVRYLNSKCAEIDSLIADIEKEIALLEEYKKSVITEAVTKGLDPSVEMKDSGIEWLGITPKNWDITRLKYYGSLQNGISKGGEYFGEGTPFVSYGDAYRNFVLPYEVTGLVRSTKDEQIRYSVHCGDAFFTRTSENLEEIGFSSVCERTINDAVFAGFLIRFRPNKKDLSMRFAKYYFRSEKLRLYYVTRMMIVTRASLSQQLLGDMPLLLPQWRIQEQIADYLDAKCSEIDSLIKEKQDQLTLLADYKKSLIYEYVTGKKEVPANAEV